MLSALWTRGERGIVPGITLDTGGGLADAAQLLSLDVQTGDFRLF